MIVCLEGRGQIGEMGWGLPLVVLFLLALAAGPWLNRWLHREGFAACPLAKKAPEAPKQAYPMPVASNDVLVLANPEGEETAPWDRHPVHDSIPLNVEMKPELRYNVTFEMDNIDFDAALKQVFHDVKPSPQCTRMDDASDLAKWGPRMEPRQAGTEVRKAYDASVAYLTARVAKAPELALVPEGVEAPPIQVVHDRWLSYRAHLASPSTTVLIELEAVLYRDAKFHGKHIHATMYAQRDPRPNGAWESRVVAVEVVGTVWEDHIAMHPVLPVDPLAVREQSQVPFDPNPLRAYPTILMDDDAVVDLVRRTRGEQQKQLAAELAVGAATESALAEAALQDSRAGIPDKWR